MRRQSRQSHDRALPRMSGPFGDLVVVDVATLNGAPQIATFFADLGARVIKVEHPARRPVAAARRCRGRGAPVEAHEPQQGVRHARRRGARRPRAPGPPARARRLLVSALSASRLAAWRLDATALQTSHPRLVAVNLTTYGAPGPVGRPAGLRHARRAVTGLAHLTGPAERAADAGARRPRRSSGRAARDHRRADGLARARRCHGRTAVRRPRDGADPRAPRPAARAGRAERRRSWPARQSLPDDGAAERVSCLGRPLGGDHRRHRRSRQHGSSK